MAALARRDGILALRAAALAAAALAAAALGACDGADTATWADPLTAYCTATVNTAGGPVTVDVETYYLPHVIHCENGAAAYGALEVQAIAARSYLYYRLARTGSIGDGTGDQVYTCGGTVTADHLRAAAETAGIVLRYPPDTQATQVAAFFVAGALQAGPTCRGGTSDPTNTERFVTYNEGKSGSGITQTTLGFVDPTNYANRGCMSQNGSNCLAQQGRGYEDMLRFYYGDDIAIVHTTGPCVPELDAGVGADPDAGPGADDVSGGCCSTGGGSPRAGIAAGLLAAAVGRGLRRRRRV